MATKDISKAYQKKTHREHILSLPDTYIGSIANTEEDTFVRKEDAFEPATLTINPGFYKLIDELIVNAHDHVVRLRSRKSDNPVKSIAITCDKHNFTIENDGEPIDVVQHPEHKVWVPQMIFAELLTSTNYDKDEKKLVGGKNGYGVKLVNIFAKKMNVIIKDGGRGLTYSQTFADNMTTISKPDVVKTKAKKSSVAIHWFPDFARFGMTEITSDMLRLLERRIWDLAMTVGKDTKVSYNGEVLKCKSLTEYAKSYGCDTIVAEIPNERWNIVVGATPTDHLFQMSFVNGIWTSKGGTHVDSVVNQVASYIVDYLESKKKTKTKLSLVKDHLALFLVSFIENPSFTSQTKETLTTKVSAFGSSPKLSDETLKKVVSKLGIVEKILEAQGAKDAKDNSKTDGKKQSRITGIPKLDDAMYAGTTKSQQCTLILTEGDSAKAMALSGLSQEQRKFFGVFPLKGKVLNVKDTSDAKVEHTKEIAELKKIIGLQSGKKYSDTSSLRYGSVMIMTDQDYDGSHIRGLLINLFHELWHELIAIPGFITYMATPIVKAIKGNGKETKNFYSQYEYEQWKKTGGEGWKVKYYKGLGTSTRDEAKDYFANMNAVKFDFTEGSDEAIELAFNKQRADDRKTWLQGYQRSALIPAGNHLPYTDFVNKDLIHFSYYNLERSIPSVVDGLKTSQRKILYAAFKRRLTTEIRVAQFAGYVSEHTGYHHGEASLNETIIGMSQDFMGSNNMPWFVPQGQFGTRLQGGKDSASPRYIHTFLQKYVKSLVPDDDFPVLTYRDDDGTPVEPEYYTPILPMLLVNGARGIGTGYSTNIPPCNPADLKKMIVDWLGGNENALMRPLQPYYKGFKGTITEEGDMIGVWKKEKDEIVVTELPPGCWTQSYREFLEKELTEGRIKDFADTSTDVTICFRIKGMDEKTLLKSITEKSKTTNMHAFDRKGVIRKYDTPNDILKEFVVVRMETYEARRKYRMEEVRNECILHRNLVRFIRDQIADHPDIVLKKKTRVECDRILETHTFAKIKDGYDYIMSLPVSTFTAEMVAKHEKQLRELEEELRGLETTTPRQMWLADLTKLSF